MMKKVLAAGFGGGIVMVVWLLASNAILRTRAT